MTTLAQLRTSLRLQLEDSGGSPLYADTTLNDYIVQAIRQYGTWAPLTKTTTTVVATDATTVTLPATVTEHLVVRVLDGTGADLRVMNGRVGYGVLRSAYTEQAFRVWDGKLILQRKVSSSEAGTWSLDHLIPRPTPAADGDTLSIIAGDEPVVLQLAYAASLQQRATEDYKRGDPHYSEGRRLATEAKEAARVMFAQSRRRAHTTWMDVA